MAEDGIDKLTADMAAGDANAVAAFYERYFDRLLAQAKRACGRDESFCLDVVQDSMLRIIRAIKRVETERALNAWLKIVVQSTAFDLLRQEHRRVQRETASVGSRVGWIESPLHPASDDEAQIDWLRQEIAGLDPRLAQMIELRYDQKWTLARIGQKLGFSAGAIDGRLRRVLSDLRKRAAKEGIGDA